MKPICLLLLLLLNWPACAQQQLLAPLPVNAATGLVTYTAVVPTPGIIQASLLARAKVWANRVGVPNKPPVVVNELGTDVLVVAGSQSVNSTYDITPRTLYYLAQVSVREGRYQYHFEELTLESGGVSTPPTYETAEALFLPNPPPRASGNSYATRLRKAFDEAIGQAAATLHTALTTPLAGPTAGGVDW